MSSTSPPPGPSGPPPPEAAPLTMRERDALTRIAAAEFRADPRFANDLAAGRVTDSAGRAPRWVAALGLVLVVAVVVGFVLGGAVLIAAVLVGVVLVPGALVVWSFRQGASARRGREAL